MNIFNMFPIQPDSIVPNLTILRVETTIMMSLGDWNHYAMTFNESGLSIYENGSLTISNSSVADKPILRSGYLVFGQV